MEQCRLGRLQPPLIQICVILRIIINDIIISAIQQNIGMVISQIVVSCLHCIIHDIFRTSDMEIRMGHMDVLIRILLDKVQSNRPPGSRLHRSKYSSAFLHRPPKCLCRAQVSVLKVPAAVPFKGAVCATLCKSAVQGADVITYRSHDSVFRMLFLVAKA